MAITWFDRDFEHQLVKVDATESIATIDRLLQQEEQRGLSFSTRFYLAPPVEGDSRSPHEDLLRARGFRPLCWSVLRRWYAGEGGQIGNEVWLGPTGEVMAEVRAPTLEWEHPAGAMVLSAHLVDGQRLVMWPVDHLAPTGDAIDLFATGDFEEDLETFHEEIEIHRAAGRAPIRVTDLSTLRKLDNLAIRCANTTDPNGHVIAWHPARAWRGHRRLIVLLVAVLTIATAVFGSNFLFAWLAIPSVFGLRLLGWGKPRPARAFKPKLLDSE